VVAPVIGQGIRAALAREQAALPMGGVADGMVGVIALERDGQVLSHNAAASFWTDALRETWMPRAPGIPQLPTAVWMALAALRSEGAEPPVPMLHVSSAHGIVRVEASWSTDGTAMVVLAPAQRPALPVLPDHWPLTPQERRVLIAAAQGLTNRQIAAHLSVSEHTIVSHLAHAYEKLGVHSRTQLLARLFQQMYLPQMTK
jgi:DNA-binding CsgD family transcriptional regulator